MDEAFRQKALEAYHQLMDMGLRVLAFAYKDRKQSYPQEPGEELKDQPARDSRTWKKILSSSA